jgi:hypothetical protein
VITPEIKKEGRIKIKRIKKDQTLTTKSKNVASLLAVAPPKRAIASNGFLDRASRLCLRSTGGVLRLVPAAKLDAFLNSRFARTQGHRMLVGFHTLAEVAI